LLSGPPAIKAQQPQQPQQPQRSTSTSSSTRSPRSVLVRRASSKPLQQQQLTIVNHKVGIVPPSPGMSS
jgi:hypothetical protein